MFITKRAPPTASLERSLTIPIIAIMLLFFFSAEALTFSTSLARVRDEIKAAAEAVSGHVEQQFDGTATHNRATSDLPDLNVVRYSTFGTGLCAQYQGPAGFNTLVNCTESFVGDGALPNGLARLGSWLLGTDSSVSRAVYHRGNFHGTLVISADTASALTRIWGDSSKRISLALILLLIASALQNLVIRRVLRPTQDILDNFDRLAQGDRPFRLPDFQILEFQRFRNVANKLAVRLDRAIRERRVMANTVVKRHEQECYHLARELHDEFAQDLNAINFVAASIKETAETECPGLAPEANQLCKSSNAVMRSLRTVLRTLRFQQVDSCDLADGLSDLVRRAEQRSGGKLKVYLQIDGPLQELSAGAALHVYRIAQEGLTNIVKHSNASRAEIRLVRSHGCSAQDACLTLTIEDNGCNAAMSTNAISGSGFGLLGMRERVLALGGQLDVSRPGKGSFKVCAVIPLAEEKGLCDEPEQYARSTG